MIGISVKDFGISFGNMDILNNVSFEVKAGEIVSILGPSGSGKSTILRSIASLQDNYEGEILLNENCLISKTQCNKDIGYIFQDYALFPHLNVSENIEFALQGMHKLQKQRRVDDLLKQFDLVDHRNKQIHELSGGQQQRVAIARVMAYKPKILLLDEPFANLDSILRSKTKIWLKKIIKESGLSAILVTHDKKEALSMSDKIAILHDQTIAQFGTPKEIFENPKSLYIANFLGDINLLPNEVVKEKDESKAYYIHINETKVTTNITQHELHLNDLSFCGNYYEIEFSLIEYPDYIIKVIMLEFDTKSTYYLDLTDIKHHKTNK